MAQSSLQCLTAQPALCNACTGGHSLHSCSTRRCVSAERAAEMMARGDIATPSLGDATKAAFRGQVRLQPPIRRTSLNLVPCAVTMMT